MKISINAQSSVKIVSDKTVYFDPFMLEDTPHDADVIFITHPHHDHFSPEDIAKVKNDNTLFIVPKTMTDMVEDMGISGRSIIGLVPSESASVCQMNVTAVPAYNLNKPMHKKEYGWLGYVVEIEHQKLYVAGDMDAIREAEQLEVDVAFLPIGGTYTMDYAEAAELVNKMKSKKVIPYHYGTLVGKKTDGVQFAKLVNPETEVELI